MSCPEGAQVQSETAGEKEDEKTSVNKNKKSCPDGAAGLELNSFKNLKTWKKSLSHFFRHSLRSTRSNDGDRPSSSKENFGEKEVGPEQKWQSLGKAFRRNSLVQHLSKGPNQKAECSSQNKKLAVKKVLSSYFGKTSKSPSVTDEK